MPKKFLVNFIIWVLLQILIEVVNSQMTPFKPSVSSSHTATFIDNKLYILGGNNLGGKFVKEFFYLDVSVPFNTQELSWKDLSNINMVPLHGTATSAKGGTNNNTLFLYGGYTTDQTMALVYTFDSQSVSWNIPKITGANAVRKWGLTGVMDYKGKFYLWGGTYMDDVFSNEMLILDIINLEWKKGSLLNAPAPIHRYGAALLPNNKIIYIGGTLTFLPFDDKTLNIKNGVAHTLSEVYIYDTINDNWDTKATSGKIPSNRAGFSTILGLDDKRVIIYGGVFNNPGYLDTTLYVLDIENFNWYVPKISGTIPKPRIMHQTNLIGKYMVISFGIGYDTTVESDILLLDISNNEEYVWTTIFDSSVPKNIPSQSPPSSPIPSPPLPSSSQLSNNSSNNSINVTGAVVGSLIGGIFLSVGIFFLYRWNKNKQKQKINHKDENSNNCSQEEKEITKRDHHGHEVIQINDNTTVNYEPTKDHGQEVIKINENTTVNYEPTKDHHGQEIILTSKNESTTNHEPITSESVNNDENFSLQAFKDEMLQAVQAVKQENQNLRNEILQAVKENYNNTKNNTE